MAQTCITDNLLQQAHIDTIFDSEYMGKRKELKVLDAILENQSKKFPVAQSAKECTRFSFNWDVSCGSTTADCTSDCSVVPLLADNVNCAEYTIDNCKEYVFSVSEEEYKCIGGDAMFNEKVAREMLLGQSTLTQSEVIPHLLAEINSLAGQNQYTGGGYTVGATDTTINPAAWNSNLLGYFRKVKQWNKYNKGIIISGNGALEQDVFNSTIQGGATEEMYKQLGIYFDEYNIMNSLMTSDSYLIDMNRVKLITTHFNENTVSNIAYPDGSSWATWSIENKFMPGTMIDIHHKVSCANDKYNVHTFKLKLRFKLISAPADVCDSTAHALKFICA